MQLMTSVVELALLFELFVKFVGWFFVFGSELYDLVVIGRAFLLGDGCKYLLSSLERISFFVLHS